MILWHNEQELTRWPVSLNPASPFRSSFTTAESGGEWGLSLVDQTGRPVAQMGQAPSTQPTPTPVAITLPQATPAAVVPSPAATTVTPSPTPLPPPGTPFPTSTTVPTAAPTASTVPLEWDPQLDALGIQVTPAPADAEAPVYRLISARYLDEGVAAGLHHVFVEVLDEAGQRIVGQPVKLAWKDGSSTMITEDKPYPEYAANAPLYGSMADGTYQVYVDQAASDIVTGLGLPGKHHIGYQLTFQRGVNPVKQNTPTPVTTASPSPTPTTSATPNGSGGTGAPSWDPRLDELGVELSRAAAQSGQPVFRLVSAQFQDDVESKGMHHVFVEVVDENGQRLVGQPVILAWADGQTKMVTENKPLPEYAANAPLFGPMDQGTYTVYVEGAPSDRVSGLGLPGNHHVSYLLKFQRQQR